jgi:2-polyprenyl-3-methyl-5-hydroxy-6-metoxy-1,4-benzoquinol methylase
VYNPLTLAVYDWYVLGFSNARIWHCPTPLLLRHYDEHVSAAHLDVGVGTGYFLDKCHFPVANPRIVLMDLNPHPLRVAARRIQRYYPQTFQANVLEPIRWDGPRFNSIAVNYVLHCLPGTIADKAAVFAHLVPLLHDGCPLFGSTILHGGVHQTRGSRRLMALYNAIGAFCNSDDDLEGLDQALTEHFSRYELTTSGSVALFTAWK